MADDTPKVVGGRLDRPYPIKTLGDVSRARVLPPPRTQAAPKAAAAPAAPTKSPTSEQPQGALDYVKKRNALQKELQGKAPVQRSLTSR
jgi:hypothetical protein